MSTLGTTAVASYRSAGWEEPGRLVILGALLTILFRLSIHIEDSISTPAPFIVPYGVQTCLRSA
jgi:hypothetical protein